MGPPVKKCKGCSSNVVNPVTCADCGIISHAGASCLARTGHLSDNGRLLNCGRGLSGSAVVVDVMEYPSVKSTPSYPTIEEISEVMSALVDKKFNEFHTDMVASIRSELGEIRSIMSDLSNRVRILEENSLSTSARSTSTPEGVEKVIAEMSDRQVRAGNVIVHGLPELPNASLDTAISNDSVTVTGMLNQILPRDYTDIRVRRLGKRKDSSSLSSSRPLCVELKSPEAVKDILKNKSRYSGSCKITDDKTLMQRQTLANLRVKLRELQDGGDTSKTIRYIHGVPNIVPKN